MIHRRLSMITFLTLVVLVSQFIPLGNSDGVTAAGRCNSAAFIADVTVPDGSVFSSGVSFVKTWRLKNTGTCTWTSAYSLAFVSGDPLGATSSVPMPTVAPGQQVDLSLDMNAPTTPGHYRGYWMMKDGQGVMFGLGINADSPFWVDINVSSSVPPALTLTPTTTDLNLQGTVRLNGVGLAGIRIYRRYAGYPGVLVATSGADGQYKADFMSIPGDETITIWAELAGYTFDPANYMWRHYYGLENRILDFTAVPSPPSPPPPDGTVFDFTREMCAARWVSGAGQLPCPSTDGDARGFVLSVDHPMLENGSADSAPGLLVSPQNKYNGYIQGFFPEYTVQPGDHFRASVGCAYGSSCYVTYRLDYQINNGAIKILWTWREKNEGMIYQLDKDLSALAGQKVSFILTLLATGPATSDRALWGQPRIVHAGGSIPTSPPITPIPTTGTPPVTAPPPPPSSGTVIDFAADLCFASWKSGAGALPCPGTDGDGRGFVLPVSNPKLESGVTDNASALILFPQNKYGGYIQGTYPEIAIQAGDRFQGIVNCAYGASCYVTFRLDYQIGSGPVRTFWSWKEKNEGLFYRVDKDLSVLAGNKVKFMLTILATGPATGDRALWSQPRIVRTGYVPPQPTPTSSPTPSPTVTSIPPGNVTEVKAAVKVPDFVNCAGTLNVEFLGSITTDGPATVRYHWEIGGATNNTTAESTLVFTAASTQPANINAYAVNCGNYFARLVVTSPNAVSAQADFSLSIPTVLPIYDFNTFSVIGTMSCSDFANYSWRQEACNGESGGCWISQTPLFGNNYAGFFRHDGNTICGLNIP